MSQQLLSKTTFAIAITILSFLMGVTAQAQVTAVITADNAYGFGYGTATAIPSTQYYGGIENLTAADIFSFATGAETYTVYPAITDYLYIVAWSDDVTKQGVLGQFKNGSLPSLYTGIGNWQVFATGINFDSNALNTTKGPSLALINQQIIIANKGIGTLASSGGWVGVKSTGQSLAIGELNDTLGGDFPQVAGIDSTARWMWFNVDPTKYNAFTQGPGTGGHKEFLIFRIPARAIVTPADFRATTVCQGAATSFSGVSAGGNVTSWEWDLGDGTTATDQNLTHTYMTAGTYNVTLCINGGSSCVTKPVTVNPLPVVQAIHGPTTKCQLSTSYSVKNLGYTYSWSVSNGTITSPTTGSSVNVTWKSSGASLLTVTITSASGCSTTSSILVTPCTATTTVAAAPGTN